LQQKNDANVGVRINLMNEDKHKLDKLESKLYSRTNSVEAEYKKHELHAKSYETPRVWNDDLSSSIEDSIDSENIMSQKTKNPFYKLLIGSIVFLFVSIAVAVFMILGGSNNVSSDNINIIIGGPIQIGGGQELSLDVGIENKNNVPLQLVDVVLDYPPGAKTADDLHSDLKRDRINIGDIDSGEFAHKIFKTVLFGEEGSTQEIKVSIEYRVPGSNAVFKKEKTFSILLNSSPVSIVTKGLKEITSGQEASFEVTVTSNSDKPLNKLVLKAEYPFGYSFKEASPSATDGNDTWKIGNLLPKETRTIKISGTLQGQNDEERYFKFTLGNASASDDKEIGTVLALSSQVLAIKRAFLGIDMSINNSNTDEFAISDGGTINSKVEWVNNTSEAISNAEFIVVFSGDILDRMSVSASDGGYYDSTNNTISWNRRTTENLGKISPGEKGRLSFSFKVRSTKKTDLQLKIDVGSKAQRVSESNVEEQINSAISKIVKITTGLHLASKALYFTGPLENSGPMPPKANNETSYTIVWSVTNTLNNVSNAKVTATLPPNVSFGNVISPSTEKLSADKITGNLVWDVGAVPAEAGFSKPKREVSFQVILKPSLTEVGESPALIGEQILTGQDNYSDAQVTDKRSYLTTKLLDDSGFSKGNEVVQP
jgi:hypothetical protein